MAGFGKNSRGGKRTSSSSSCGSTVTMVLFVSFCILGLWMLSSSSIIPSQLSSTSTTNAHHHTRASFSSDDDDRNPSRFIVRDPPPVLDDTQGDLPEDAIKGDGERVTEEDEEKPGSKLSLETAQGDQEKETFSDGGAGSKSSQESLENQQQQQQQEETPQSEEENQQGHREEQEQEKLGGNEESEHQQQQVQERREEEEIGGNGEEQQQAAQNSENGADENQQQSSQVEGESQMQSEEQQQSGAQSNQEQQQNSHEEQQMESNDEKNRQESQQNDDNQQENQAGIDEIHDQTQQQTEDGLSGSQSDEGGVESQSQIEHDTEGTSEEQQQPSQQQMEDESSHPEEKLTDPNASESLPDGSQSEVSNESGDGNKKPWSTQADQSVNEKERRKGDDSQFSGGDSGSKLYGYEWELCNVTAGPDYIPCLDNEKAIKQLHSFKHFEHRERHCPEESPTCLVPLPKGYRHSIEWPKSRDRIWYNNVPHTKLAEVKGHQNWVKVTGQYLTFPGGGTQFIHGALHYIDFIQQSVHAIAWGKHTRVVLDVGCGVASFGGYLFERDVVTMSFAPKDEHEAQVQFALERGIPAISAVMGSQRLPFPSRVYDIVHCARCRVPWHANGGALLLELNRVLRPGGYFVWSATPVYQKLKEDVEIWKAMTSLTISMCWDLYTIKKDRLNSIGVAIYRKPISNECYDNRKHHSPPMCREDDDPNAAWYVPLQSCMHRVPVDASERGSQWPEEWPQRVRVPPYWLNSSQMGVYGKPAPDDFISDYEHWKRVVTKSYLSGLGISWSRVRNVMDMRAVYGGFAAALKDLKIWVMNVVNVDSPDTLPIIFERGLFGIYHDWCESFSTYPRTYDLLHADQLFSRLKKRCKILPVIAEVDRIVRPGGKLIVRDDSAIVGEVESILKSLHWEIRLTFSKDQEGILCAEKSDWRPSKLSDLS